MTTYHRRRLVELKRALDEAHFGPERTLNLRATLPTVAEAVRRTESWLRERQASGAGEVLIITGRGNASEDGVSVVREAVQKVLRGLKKAGVVDTVAQQSPGSFIATLAPMRRLWEKSSRPAPVVAAAPAALAGLDPETIQLLRELALRSLASLGVRDPGRFVDNEMTTQLADFVRAVPEGVDRERRLRDAVQRALRDDDDGRSR